MKKKQKKSPREYLLLAGALVALLAAYLLLGRHESTATGSLMPKLPPAELTSGAAPSFTLEDLHGRQVSLSDFRGKVVVVDFWATWCPPCKREIPDFIELQQVYGSKGVQIVGIALDQSDKVRAFALEHGMNYPVLLGTDDVSERYGGISGIPTTFILDRNGKIADRFEGFRPKEIFESTIKRLL